MILPVDYKFDKANRILEVLWGDGSIVRYFDIDPRLHFLDPFNPGRNADFMAFLAFGRTHKPGCLLEQPNQRVCVCPAIKSEVIQEATQELSEPKTRPLLVSQQSGEHQ